MHAYADFWHACSKVSPIKFNRTPEYWNPIAILNYETMYVYAACRSHEVSPCLSCVCMCACVIVNMGVPVDVNM